MSFEQECPACGRLLRTDDIAHGQAIACPKCNTSVLTSTGKVNPYAAPSTSLDPDFDDIDVAPVARTSVLQKYREAFGLLASNLDVIGLLVLIVWLPAHLFMNALSYQGSLDQGGRVYLQWNAIVDGIFGPFYVGGMIHILSLRKRGMRASFAQASRAGFRHWGRLFGTRLLAGIVIFLGFIALIIPGIILSVRYSLLDSIVVLEGRHGSSAMRRSSELSRGRRWSLLSAFVLFWLLFLPCSLAANALLETFDPINNMVVTTLLDCVLQVFSMVLTIVTFLFYWEAVNSKASPEV
jgi:hypothetical protein